MMTIDLSRTMLGNRLITEANAVSCWPRRKGLDTAIRYNEASFDICSEQNRLRQANWWLVFVMGLTLEQQVKRRGTKPKKNNWRPCFFVESDVLRWGRQADEFVQSWTPSGYYLIDFFPRFRGLSFAKQEVEIARFGSRYGRLDEVVFAEASMTVAKIHRDRVAPDWYHWGCPDSNGLSICVGRFDDNGMDLQYRDREAMGDDRLAACVYRKHDFYED